MVLVVSGEWCVRVSSLLELAAGDGGLCVERRSLECSGGSWQVVVSSLSVSLRQTYKPNQTGT